MNQACSWTFQAEQLLQGQLPLEQLPAFETHLSACDECQNLLRNWPADVGLQSRIQDASQRWRADIDLHSALIRKIISSGETLQPQVSATIISDNSAASDDADDTARLNTLLALLEPCSEPESLGSIGDFIISRVLGSGGMGVVFAARDSRLNREVALKLLMPEIAEKRSARERFLRESRAAAAIRNEHVVTIFQAGEVNGLLFLAQELVVGESLEQRLAPNIVLPQIEAIRIASEIAAGLAAAHQKGILHRDIKPSNVMVESSTGRVRLLDFGLALPINDQAQLTSPGMLVGTPAYMSPEQAQSDELDARSDLFSLGCILYRMLTGKTPFSGTNVLTVLRSLAVDTPRPAIQLNPQIDADLSRLIEQLISRDRDLRPASAEIVLNRLQQIHTSLSNSVSTPSVKTASTPARPRAPRRTILAVSGFALLCLLGIWIRIRARDGSVVATIEVEDLKSVSVNTEPGTTAEILQTNNAASATRPNSPAPVPAEVTSTKQEWKFQPVPIGTSPWDQLDPALIPPSERFRWQPPELVAVLGSHARRYWLDAENRLAVISPDGRLAVTSAAWEFGDGLIIWDVESQSIKAQLPPEKSLYGMQFSPDGKRLIGRRAGKGAEFGSCALLDLSGQEPVEIPVVDHGKFEASVAHVWLGDAQTAVVTTPAPEPTLAIYRFVDQQGTAVLQVGSSLPLGTQASPAVAVAPYSGHVVYLDANDRLMRTRVLIGEFAPSEELQIPVDRAKLRELMISPDGDRLIVRNHEGFGTMWDINSSPPVAGTAAQTGIHDRIRITSDGKWILQLYNDAKICPVKELKWLDPVVFEQTYGAGAVCEADVSRDGRRAITFSSLGLIQFWDLSHGRPVALSPLSPEPAFKQGNTFISPVDNTLVLERYEDVYGVNRQFWTPEGGVLKPLSVMRPKSEIVPVEGPFFPVHRNRGVFLHPEGRPRILEFTDGEWDRQGQEFGDSHTTYGALTHGGQRLVTLNTVNNRSLIAWDLNHKTPRKIWEHPIEPRFGGEYNNSCLSVSADGTVAAIAPSPNAPPTDKKEVLVLKIGKNPPAAPDYIPLDFVDGNYMLKLSPDGRFLAHLKAGPSYLLFIEKIGANPPEVAASRLEGLSAFSFSPDGRYLACASVGGVKILRVPSLEPVAQMRLFGCAHWLDWTPDCRHIVTLNWNKTVYVLRVTELLEELQTPN